ncbi:hypothetical protein [Cellulomonas sp. NPDC089187]|uniref:hypothetical protein n=1 Tax=Cellulomonas sp. NPDC089187 TaxID=3154970 RepID=UPI0034316CC7
MSERAVPVSTDLGVFGFWRNTIIVERVEWEGRTITLTCDIHTSHLTGYTGTAEDIQATITFTGVVSMFHAELDTYEAIPASAFTVGPDPQSDLERIEGSRYRERLPIRPDWAPVEHFRLWSYDDVFDVLATGVTVSEIAPE